MLPCKLCLVRDLSHHQGFNRCFIDIYIFYCIFIDLHCSNAGAGGIVYQVRYRVALALLYIVQGMVICLKIDDIIGTS